MVNLSEAEEIRVPLRSVESSEQEVSHRCCAALSFSQEDVLRVCQKRTCRKTRRREKMVLLAASRRALRCSPRFSTQPKTTSSSLELETHPCEHEARFDSGRRDYLHSNRLSRIAFARSPLPSSRENFGSVCPPVLFELLGHAFQVARANEGSVWLLDIRKENLVITYNSGPNAASIVGFRQPLNRGIVSTVLVSEQAFIENEVYKNARHDDKLNESLAQTTFAMIVVPLYFLNECRGVVSCGSSRSTPECEAERRFRRGRFPADLGLPTWRWCRAPPRAPGP